MQPSWKKIPYREGGTRLCPDINKSKFVVFDCFDGTLIRYFKNVSSFDIEPPGRTPLTLPEVIENIWQNVDRDYHVRILAKRLLRIDKDMNADARTQFAAWIPEGDMGRFAKELPQQLKQDFAGKQLAAQNNMSLETTLTDITARLRQGKFPNEQAISQGIVLRVFQELGWDTWDTNVVWPEFQTGEGRADFALCHPPSKPAVFTEVKQPGKAEEAVRQALEYAFHAGVPFVVLTDGRTWSFYLPAEQGSYEDRRVYKLDLYERPPVEAGEILHRYLERARVESGEALEAARKEYRSRNRRSQAKAAIPEAWRELVEKGDELLVDMLTSAVESKAGVRPDADDVAEFLADLGRPVIFESAAQRTLPAIAVSARPIPPRTTSESSRSGKLVLLGKVHAYHNAKDAMLIVLRELAKTEPSFLERCSQHPDAQGRKRRYIARTPEELYPDREDLRDMRETLPGGWLVATNLNNVLKKTIIRLATEVAGLSFGKDVIVDL